MKTNKIEDQIAKYAEMQVDDFNYIPFNQEGLPALCAQASLPAHEVQAGLSAPIMQADCFKTKNMR